MLKRGQETDKIKSESTISKLQIKIIAFSQKSFRFQVGLKINGNVTRIINSLHGPGLDSDLFSVTKHERMDHGHFLLLEGGNMHLSFPKFSITQTNSEDGDLRVPLDPMSIEDWNIPTYVLDGDNCSDDYLNNYKDRIDMLNWIAKG